MALVKADSRKQIARRSHSSSHSRPHDQVAANPPVPSFYGPLFPFGGDPFFNEIRDMLFSWQPAFGDPWQPPSRHPSLSTSYPRMNVFEDRERNVATATFELPGMDSRHVAIDVHHNTLTVSGEARFEEEREERGYVVRERRAGHFARSIPIPEGIKDEDIKASMRNGVLTVTFPLYSGRMEHRPRRIPISSA